MGFRVSGFGFRVRDLGYRDSAGVLSLWDSSDKRPNPKCHLEFSETTKAIVGLLLSRNLSKDTMIFVKKRDFTDMKSWLKFLDRNEV